MSRPRTPRNQAEVEAIREGGDVEGQCGPRLNYSRISGAVTRTSTSREDLRLLAVIAAGVVIACLYFARVVFVPVSLAVLLSLLLTPVIVFLEKIRLPRLLAIFLVVVSFVGLAGLIGWKTSQQFIDLTDQLPTYK